MQSIDAMALAQIKIQSLKNRQIRRLFDPAFTSTRNRKPSTKDLSRIGYLVGLSESEVKATTEHYRGAFSRFLSRMLLVIVLGFFTLIMLSIVAADSGWVIWDLFQEEPIITYTPGTRYGAIGPSDFK